LASSTDTTGKGTLPDLPRSVPVLEILKIILTKSTAKQKTGRKFNMHPLVTNNIAIVFFFLILIAAAVTDLRAQRIPNLLTMPSILAALIYYTVLNGTSGLIFSICGLAAGIGLLILPYLMGGMGAGDAKLMGVVGAFVGAHGVFISFLLTAVAGGFYALLLLVAKRRHFNGFLRSKLKTLKTYILIRQYIPDAIMEKKRRPRLCYGLAIALGSITYMVLDLTGYAFPI
jgi:prepilin peptidase CpaA